MLFNSVYGGNMSLYSTLLTMKLEELLDTIEMFPVSKKDKALKIMNDVIKRMLNEYCKSSEHFDSVKVSGQNTIVHGYYGMTVEDKKGTEQVIVMDESLLDFVHDYKKLMMDDYGEEQTKLEIGINTYLHENRHAKQLREKMPMCTMEYNSENYFMHPMEVDARTHAELYIHEAMEYITENIEDRVVPQFMSLLGM